MEFLAKIERAALQWAKDIPHLPVTTRKWLGENVWWLAAIGAVISGIVVIAYVLALLGRIFAFAAFDVSPVIVTWMIISTIVSIVFAAVTCVLLGAAVTPLRERQKKGWVLLFAVWLVSVIGVVLTSVITLDAFEFMKNAIMGVLLLAISGYLLFEIHSQFAHVERSKGVKEPKAAPSDKTDEA